MTVETRPADTARPGPADPPTATPEPASLHHRFGRRRRRGSTALRLAAFHTTLLAVVLAIVVVVLLHQFTVGLQSIAQSTLAGELDTVTAELSSGQAGQAPYQLAKAYLASHALPAGQELLVSVDHHAGALGSPGALELARDPAVASLVAHPPIAARLVQVQIRQQYYDAEVEALQFHGRIVGAVLTATTLTTINAQHHRLLVLSLAEGSVAVAVGALAAYLVLRQLLRTIGRMTAAAGDIEEGNLGRRLGDPGTGDEVSKLARTLDAMLDRIAAAMDAQRRLLSDVSHQLRTPMTVARGHLEVLARTGYDDEVAADETVVLVLDELDRMAEMVNSLLLLGRAMEPDFLQEEPVDVRALLAEVHAAASVLADRSWTMGEVVDVVLSADVGKLRGALLNLVENAAKATVPGDQVVFSCTLDPVAGAVILAVDDSGPGIPEAMRSTALQRFGRLPEDRSSGSGLGLAIVDAVARAHGGWVELGQSKLGGARVAIALPDRRRWLIGAVL